MIFKALRQFFKWIMLYIRPAEQGDGWDGRGKVIGWGGGREGGGQTSIQTLCSSCDHLWLQGIYHVEETFMPGAMAAVSGHGSTGALQRYHSLNRDITRSAKYLRKTDQLTLDSKTIM